MKRPVHKLIKANSYFRRFFYSLQLHVFTEILYP